MRGLEIRGWSEEGGCERKDGVDLDERMEMAWKVAEVREYAAVSTIDADRGLEGSCRCFLLSCRGLNDWSASKGLSSWWFFV